MAPVKLLNTVAAPVATASIDTEVYVYVTRIIIIKYEFHESHVIHTRYDFGHHQKDQKSR